MTVAVVVPVRSAAGLLAGCVDRIRNQSHPPDEVIIAVAPSGDGTSDVARQLAMSDSSIRLVDNLAGDRASALNAALTATAAETIAMVDAQARLAPDYLEQAMSALQATDAAVVGGPMRPVGETIVGRAMAAALRSPVGIGDSRFHYEGAAGEAESVYLGVYRAEVFRLLGGYNSALLRTEDDDMNWRIRAAGLRIWLDPSIRSEYLCRNNLRAIWAQYHGYGYWKVALATLRPGAIGLRHLAPAALIVAIVTATLLSAFVWLPALAVLLVVYLAVLVGGALIAEADGLGARLLFPIATGTMHLAYGTGTLLGTVAWSRLRRAAAAGAATAERM